MVVLLVMILKYQFQIKIVLAKVCTLPVLYLMMKIILIKNLQVIKNINLNSHGVRRLGAASLDMCHVAKGIVEGFWEYNLQPWDTAAGNIIVTEAGGTVSNENGNLYNFDKCIVVSNNKVHKDFLKIINES